MRAPGEAPGVIAFEVAVDGLAEQLGMDPIELRILNDMPVVPGSPTNPQAGGDKGKTDAAGIPFSTRKLVQCLRTEARRIG